MNQPTSPFATLMDPMIASSMFGIYIGGEGQTLPPDAPSKPTSIIVTPTGITEVREFPNYRVSRNAKGKSVELKAQLPWRIYAQIVGFFKAALPNEAVCYIWWRDVAGEVDGEGRVPPPSREWKVVVPPQRVSGSSAKPIDGSIATLTPEGDGWIRWGDIHSHNTMQPFFSGVDNADEQTDGNLYGVVGHVGRQIPEVKFRLRALGEWIDLNPDHMIASPPMWPTPPEEWVKALNPESERVKREVTTHYPSRDYRSTDSRRVILWPRKVIRRDGYVWNLWKDNSLTPTGQRVEALTTKDREESIVEGLDTFDTEQRGKELYRKES